MSSGPPAVPDGESGLTTAPGGATVVTKTVPAEAAGARLDRWLAGVVADQSRSRLQALIAAGHLTVDQATVTDGAYRVKPGTSVRLTVPPPVPATPRPQALPLDIRYEDHDLIVVCKPPGMAVHPAPGTTDGTLVNALLHHCRGSLSGIGGVERPGIVHRLDKDTSGLMVAAKNDVAHQGLAAQFAAHTLERRYVALVWGAPTAAEGTITGAIGRDPRDRKRMTIVPRGGKPAVTHWRRLTLWPGPVSLVECRLETGRTHQIRVHLSHHHLPLVGDPVYGRPPRRSALSPARFHHLKAFPRQALHARTLGFIHPVSGKDLVFESDLPSDINSLVVFLEEK